MTCICFCVDYIKIIKMKLRDSKANCITHLISQKQLNLQSEFFYLPNDTLSSRSNRFEVLVSFEDCEFGISHLNGVKLGKTRHLIAPLPEVLGRCLRTKPRAEKRFYFVNIKDNWSFSERFGQFQTRQNKLGMCIRQHGKRLFIPLPPKFPLFIRLQIT